MNENSRRWISVKDASLRLGLHPVTVYKMAGRGEIPAGRLGRKLFIDWKRCEEQLEAQTDRKAK